MSSGARVSESARYEGFIRPPQAHGLRIDSSAFCQPVAQTLRPDIGPVLFDVVETCRTVRIAVDRLPPGWNLSEGRPQAVLLLVVDQDEKVPLSSSDGLTFMASPDQLVETSEQTYGMPAMQCRFSAKCLMAASFFGIHLERLQRSASTRERTPPGCRTRLSRRGWNVDGAPSRAIDNC